MSSPTADHAQGELSPLLLLLPCLVLDSSCVVCVLEPVVVM